ncbi:peptidoglycan-associated lipoprotein Pal [Sphingomonas sp. HT-1]|uniref:peptidoglycan-associated lipoprotein Pal n=1 Tax=unclassified Sphingomonas TaxID=196159 RepID=UPI0002EF98E3|nr:MULTISPECIES: peptidoglycan-associated lipoprotein Pal [unclassified Sphingomonas]KTF69897.1 peptidoglycan-associated lipoprotein [Sphingomonas sp. WG]
MTKLVPSLMLGVALVATAACSKKPPKELPPAPTETPVASQPYGNGETTQTSSMSEQFRREVTSDTIHFGLDQSDIDQESRAVLDSQAKWLVAHPNVRITLEGHCDERGTREYNLALGDRRANAAKNYLAAQGVSADRITTISYGKERPVAMGSDEASWAQNRRAVTLVLN